MQVSQYSFLAGRLYYNPSYPGFHGEPFNVTVDYIKQHEVVVSSKTPGWSAFQKAGGLAVNPHLHSTYTCEWAACPISVDFKLLDGTLIVRDAHDGWTSDTFGIEGVPKLPVFVFPDYGDVLANALSDANQGEIDMLTSIAELGESIEMCVQFFRVLKNPLKTFVHLRRAFESKPLPYMTPKLERLRTSNIRAFMAAYKKKLLKIEESYKRRKIKNPVNIPGIINELVNAVATIHLTWRYGIMPNVYLAQSAIALAKKNLKPRFRESSRKQSRISYSDVTQLEVYSNVPGGFKIPSGQVMFNQEFVISAGVTSDYVYASMEERFLKHEIDFNILVTAWELFPLSFVIDWGINLGNWFASIIAPSGLVKRVSYVSCKAVFDLQTQVNSGSQTYLFGPNNLHTVSWKDSSKDEHLEAFQRLNVTGQIPTPQMAIKLNFLRVADAAALMKLILLK